jgi:hypothetical protein
MAQIGSSWVATEKMYTIKTGAAIFLSPEIEKILAVVYAVFRAFNLPVVVTSGVDGPHRQGSLHYRFRAVDIRKRFPDTLHSATWEIHKREILEALAAHFGIGGYPVMIVNESDHIHIEWAGE